MAQVYRYSILNIAAEASRNAGDGIFKPRAFRRLLAKFPLRIGGKLLVFPLLRNWMESLCGDASILSKRGWVLQENMLSPRTLHFGLEQIFWSCAGTIISEGDMAPLPKEVIGRLSADWNWHLSKRFLTLQGDLSEIEPRSPYALEIWYNRWYEVVTNYSARYLTRQSDVFPALAGLAQAFTLRLQDDYIAGLFAGNLHHGILWHTDLFDEVKRAIPYRAPTWSWASILGKVEFLEYDADRILKGHPVKIIHASASPLRQLLPETTQTYGEIFYAELQMSGLWRRIDSWDRLEWDDEVERWLCTDIHGTTQMIFRFDIGTPDRYVHLSLSPEFLKDKCSMLQISGWAADVLGSSRQDFYALILQSSVREGCLGRTSLEHIYSEENDATEKGLGWELMELTPDLKVGFEVEDQRLRGIAKIEPLQRFPTNTKVLNERSGLKQTVQFS